MRAPLVVVAAAMFLAGCGGDPTPSPRAPCPTQAPTSTSAQATLADAGFATVTMIGAVEGEFVIELNGDAAPITTANFVELARCGFYDGINFHRVLAGFVIQAGDPNTRGRVGDFTGIGRGGAGYDYEIEPPAENLGYDQYSVAMANDTRTNDSQFFVSLVDLNQGLQRLYTIFGQVVSGTEVVDAIAAVPVLDPRLGIPAVPVTIASVVVTESGGVEASPSS
ncbi:MAG: peptidylprolyl isomerase [Candidatus Limnocylindria bacterium]